MAKKSSLYLKIEEAASELFEGVHPAIADNSHVAEQNLLAWLFESFEQDIANFEKLPTELSYSTIIDLEDLDDDNHSYECYAGEGSLIVVDTRLRLSIKLDVIPGDAVYLTTRPIIEEARGGISSSYDCMFYGGECLEIEDVPYYERSSSYIDEDDFDAITFESEKLIDFAEPEQVAERAEIASHHTSSEGQATTLSERIEYAFSKKFIQANNAFLNSSVITYDDVLTQIMDNFERTVENFEANQTAEVHFSNKVELRIVDDSRQYEFTVCNNHFAWQHTKIYLEITVNLMPHNGVYLYVNPIVDESAVSNQSRSNKVIYENGSLVQPDEFNGRAHLCPKIDESCFADIRFNHVKLLDL